MGEGFAHRPTLWELACLHAAARARTVEVRRGDEAVERWARRPDESPAAFLAAFRDGRRPPDAAPAADGPVLAALLRDDVGLPPGSAVYALERDRHDPAVEPLTAADLLAPLG